MTTLYDTSKLLNVISSASKLPPYIRKVYDNLSSSPQTTDVDFSDLAPILTSSKLVNHQSDEVRHFTALSISEILRISAPEAPFSSLATLHNSFSLH
ncbi:hypothetical protein GEMRC1_011645 [Eukaryota sp. GEM-RC1]